MLVAKTISGAAVCGALVVAPGPVMSLLLLLLVSTAVLLMWFAKLDRDRRNDVIRLVRAARRK